MNTIKIFHSLGFDTNAKREILFEVKTRSQIQPQNVIPQDPTQYHLWLGDSTGNEYKDQKPDTGRI